MLGAFLSRRLRFGLVVIFRTIRLQAPTVREGVDFFKRCDQLVCEGFARNDRRFDAGCSISTIFI